MSEALHLVGVLGDKVVWGIGVVAIIAAFVWAPWLYKRLKPIVYRHAKAVVVAPEVMIAAKDSIQELAKNQAAFDHNHGLLERRVQVLEAAVMRLMERQAPEGKQEMEAQARTMAELGRVTAPRSFR